MQSMTAVVVRMRPNTWSVSTLTRGHAPLKEAQALLTATTLNLPSFAPREVVLTHTSVITPALQRI